MAATTHLTCPLCGSSFDPDSHVGCASCPLHGGCTTVCCPTCGYSTVDPTRSGLVAAGRTLAGVLSRRRAVGAR